MIELPANLLEEKAEELYAKLARGEGLTRGEAEFLCDAPAPPGLFKIRPMQPGPRREWESRIMVRDVSPDTQIGSIIIPDTGQRKNGECIVLDVGRGCWDEESRSWVPFQDIKVGDRVVIGKYVGQEISERLYDASGTRIVGEASYRVMMVRDAMAKYDPIQE